MCCRAKLTKSSIRFLLIDEEKSFILNLIKLYLFLFLIFLNKFITAATAAVLFHCLSLNLFRNSLLMLSRITLLFLPFSFFTVF